jgi:hypothetical protein
VGFENSKLTEIAGKSKAGGQAVKHVQMVGQPQERGRLEKVDWERRLVERTGCQDGKVDRD